MKRRFPEVVKTERRTISNLFLTLLLIPFISLPAFAESKIITPENLRITEAKIKRLAARNMPATVAIIPAVPARMMGTGTGVIVNEEGLILTAAHVTTGMNKKVIVIFPDGKRVRGKVLGMDYSRDAAMVQITEKGTYPYVKLGDSTAMGINDWCIALGHAGGYQYDRPPPVRLGRIIRSNPKGFITTDSALISGDSGGPLFDEDGKLIGIHSNIGISLSQNNHVPISTFVENWGRLRAGESFGGDDDDALLENPDRPMIGAFLIDSPNSSGAIVDAVRSGSPAEIAGLQKGDRIFKAGRKDVNDSDGLIAAIRTRKPGDTLRMEVDSRGTKKTVTITIASAGDLNGVSPGQGPLRKLPDRTPQEVKELQTEFNRIMQDSLAKNELQLTEHFYEKFRSAAEFNRYMERFKKTLSKKELRKLYQIANREPEPIRPGNFDPDRVVDVGEEFFRSVLDSFRPSAARASDATHLVFRGQEWKSLCTVISDDGYALTKASEIDTKNNQKLGVLISKGNLLPAEVVKTYPGHDLALIKIQNPNGLVSVKLNSSERLNPGSMISAPGPGPDPVAIGLISVQPRSLTGKNKGFLGIGTAHDDKGVKVTMVKKGAGASKAGVRIGDIIMKIDDSVCDTPEKLIRAISGKTPGSDVVLQLLRNGRGQSVKVTLGNRKELDDGRPDPNGKMNRMGTDVSSKSSGFLRVTQTDLPILPQHCGGPVVDLDGNVVGINIARAGRIKTYMIPAEEVRKLVSADLPDPSKVLH